MGFNINIDHPNQEIYGIMKYILHPLFPDDKDINASLREFIGKPVILMFFDHPEEEDKELMLIISEYGAYLSEGNIGKRESGYLSYYGSDYLFIVEENAALYEEAENIREIFYEEVAKQMAYSQINDLFDQLGL